MRQIIISDKIKSLHRKYFENNILCQLDEEIKLRSINFQDEDIENVMFDDGLIYDANKINLEHENFIKYCRERWHDIAVGEPKVLNEINNTIEKKFKGIKNLLLQEVKLKNSKGKSIKYSNFLIYLFGYNKFKKTDFFDIIINKAKVTVISKQQNYKKIIYNYDVQKEIVNLLVRLFPNAERKIKDLLKKRVSEDELKERLKKLNLILTLINYDNELLENVWNAYTFVMMLGIRTCPYCNRQYITPLLSTTGQMRGDLDHFIPKSKYPYFSMSLYNIIPVCKSCNSSLKLDQEFTFNDLNPYEDSFDELAKFYADIRVNKPIEIHIAKVKKNRRENKHKNIDKHLKIFKLQQQYSYHTNQVQELIEKRLAYSEDYIKEIKHKVFKDNITEKRLKEILIGYTEDELKINDEPLAKFRRDIVKQLKFFDDSDKDLINELKKIISK